MFRQLRTALWVLGMAALLAMPGCQPAAPLATTSAATPTSIPASTVTPVPRQATILSVEGEVSLRAAEGGESRPPQAGDMLLAGGELTTGPDGRVVIELDDGTAMVIASESTVSLDTLEGTPGAPLTRFFLNIGRVFAFREGLADLPPGAALEIRTPNALLAIRGSSMSAAYTLAGDDTGGTTTGVCITGRCVLEGTAEAEAVTLEIGQRAEVAPDGALGPAIPAREEDLKEAQAAYAAAQEAGTMQDVPPEQAVPTPVPPTPAPANYEEPVTWLNNGHTYQVVRVQGAISWSDASRAAQAAGGYLATITSQGEQDFVFALAVLDTEGWHGYWLGGYQLPDAAGPADSWVWVTGEPWDYTNWDEGEPNDGLDGTGGEDRLHFHFENVPGWNDIVDDPGEVRGFVIEYED